MSAEILRDLLSAKVAFQLRTLEMILGFPAQGIDARSGETERLDPKGESPVAKPCAQGDS